MNEKGFEYYQMRRHDMYVESRRGLAEANETERNLCGQLMLLATVLLGITGAYIGGADQDNLSNYQWGLVMIVSIGLILAIMSGIKYYFEITKMEIKWGLKDKETADVLDKLSLEQDQNKIDEMITKANKIQKSKGISTNLLWLRTQILFLSCSAVGFLALLIQSFKF